jgi:hypothetical protein
LLELNTIPVQLCGQKCIPSRWCTLHYFHHQGGGVQCIHHGEQFRLANEIFSWCFLQMALFPIVYTICLILLPIEPLLIDIEGNNSSFKLSQSCSMSD